jgi:hypothetical protein
MRHLSIGTHSSQSAVLLNVNISRFKVAGPGQRTHMKGLVGWRIIIVSRSTSGILDALFVLTVSSNAVSSRAIDLASPDLLQGP